MNNVLKWDSKPWYRQFWPWFLILLPASVVVAGLVTLVIANRHADDLVSDSYYKNGLTINRELEKKQRADVLGIKAELSISEDILTVHIAGPVEEGRLNLTLSHPLEADKDFQLELLRNAPGVFSAILPKELHSRWHWILTGGVDSPWRIDGSITVADSTNSQPTAGLPRTARPL